MLAVLMVLFFPLKALSSAGWAATTLNYLWVAAFGLAAFIPLAKGVRGESVGSGERTVCFLGAIYAVNQEQMALVLFGGYLAGVIYLSRVGRSNWSLLIPLGLAACGIALAVFAPGNHLRFAAEIERLHPEFAGYSIGRKALLGYFSTASYYLAASNFNTVFLALSLAIFAGIVARRGKSGQVILAIVPVSFSLVVGFLLRYMTDGGKDTAFLRFFYNTRFVRAHGYGTAEFWGATLLFTVVALCVAGALVRLWPERSRCVAALGILGLGALSRVVVGFSPTLYASGPRTTTFCSVALLAVTLMVLSDLLDERAQKRAERSPLGRSDPAITTE